MTCGKFQVRTVRGLNMVLIFFKLKYIQLANVCSAMNCFWEYQESRFEANYVEDMCKRQSRENF